MDISNSRHVTSPRRARSWQPRLEALEDRALLSTCHVTRLSDVGLGMGFRGDLRYCVNKVNGLPGSDIIDFRVTGTIQLAGALPDITGSVDIQGPGADLLNVRRNSGGLYRIFTIPSGVSARLTGLTISNGSLDHLTSGGGISNAGTLQVVNSKVTGNATEKHGGGIYNTGTLFVTGSTVSKNTASSYFTNNYGGGIYNDGYLEVTESTIDDNYVDSHFVGLGAGIYNDSAAFVVRSTISGNYVTGYDGGDGGGIYNNDYIQVTNSTISGNQADDDEFGGGSGFGGGLFNDSVAVVWNSTIVNNVGSALGGGLRSAAGKTLHVKHTILANNRYEDGSAADLSGAFTTSAYNLIGNTSGGSGFSSTDILNVDPLLGALEDNGGPTHTHSLLDGSLAIDAGENADASEWDQRGAGFARVVNGAVDIGAFEVQA